MNKFKIGITAIGYDCKEHLENVFKPWELVKEGFLYDFVESVHVGFTHGCFVETAQLGFPVMSTDGTIEFLKQKKEEGFIETLTMPLLTSVVKNSLKTDSKVLGSSQ